MHQEAVFASMKGSGTGNVGVTEADRQEQARIRHVVGDLCEKLNPDVCVAGLKDWFGDISEMEAKNITSFLSDALPRFQILKLWGLEIDYEGEAIRYGARCEGFSAPDAAFVLEQDRIKAIFFYDRIKAITEGEGASHVFQMGLAKGTDILMTRGILEVGALQDTADYEFKRFLELQPTFQASTTATVFTGSFYTAAVRAKIVQSALDAHIDKQRGKKPTMTNMLKAATVKSMLDQRLKLLMENISGQVRETVFEHETFPALPHPSP